MFQYEISQKFQISMKKPLPEKTYTIKHESIFSLQKYFITPEQGQDFLQSHVITEYSAKKIDTNTSLYIPTVKNAFVLHY